MGITIHLKVYGFSQGSKPLLERMVSVDDSVVVDINSLFRSFQFLFGKQCVIFIEFY